MDPMDVETNSLKAAREDKEEMKKDVFKFVRYQPARDSPSDVRNALLVVVALIATITFDKGTDPPDNLKNNKTTFIIANTFAFSGSISIVNFCAEGFPFEIELRASIFAVAAAYGAGAYPHVDKPVAVTLLYFAIVAPFLSFVVRKYMILRARSK